MRVILGSSSPRRKEILDYFSLPFTQIPSEFDEEAVPFNGDPLVYAMTLSEGKAKNLARRYPDACILTADTIVFQDGKLYSKPENQKQALQFLTELAGGSHEVYTAVSLFSKQEIFSKAEMTRVFFHPLTEAQIKRYHTIFSCTDKAGGYGIQMAGSIIVKKIEGCFYNVMGLPINVVASLLKKVDIDLWDYLR